MEEITEISIPNLSEFVEVVYGVASNCIEM
jgi:hypothetical protein